MPDTRGSVEQKEEKVQPHPFRSVGRLLGNLFEIGDIVFSGMWMVFAPAAIPFTALWLVMKKRILDAPAQEREDEGEKE